MNNWLYFNNRLGNHKNKNKMNLNNEIQAATDKFVDEKLPAIVDEKVSKMVDSILESVFSNYSETAKAIKAKIEEKLDVNLQKFDLVDYNHLVSKAINDNLLQQVNMEPILKMCQNAIGFVNTKNIKLSDIVQMFIESSQEDNEQEGEGKISIHVEQNEKNTWVEVALDIDEDIEKEYCGIRFLISIERGTIFCFNTKSHWDEQREITASKITQLSTLEHKIFRLYSAGVKVEIDSLHFENEWSRYN